MRATTERAVRGESLVSFWKPSRSNPARGFGLRLLSETGGRHSFVVERRSVVARSGV